MKKVIMVLCLGQVTMMYAPEEINFSDTQPNSVVSRIRFHVRKINRALRAADEALGGPMRKYNNFVLDSAQGIGRFLGVRPNILNLLEPLRIQPPSGGATSVAGGSDVASLQRESVAEVAAIRAEGKPTVNFADQVRSVFGRGSNKVLSRADKELLTERINRIDKEINLLQDTLKNIPLKEKKRNLKISNMIIRLSEEKKLLSKKLEDRFSPVETREEREEGKADIEADIEAIKNSRKPFFMKAYNKTSEEADEFLRKDEAEEAKKRAEHSRQKHELKERIKSYKNTWPDDFRQEYPSDYNDYELPGKPTLKQYGSFSSEA